MTANVQTTICPPQAPGAFKVAIFDVVADSGQTHSHIESGMNEVYAAFYASDNQESTFKVIINSNDGTENSKHGHVYIDGVANSEAGRVVVFGN
jgi:hypothetical protein